MYIADSGNARIRKVTVLTGIISTIAGTGTGSYSGDNGQATAATLDFAIGIGLDSSGIPRPLLLSSFILLINLPITGNVYIADFNNNRLRKVTVSTGIISTIAGTGTGTYSGDGGQATAAALYNPAGVSLDTSGIILPNYSFL